MNCYDQFMGNYHEAWHRSRTYSTRTPSAKRTTRTNAPDAERGHSKTTSTHGDGATEEVRSFPLHINHERPHEALANETPGSIYVPSTRLLPSRVATFQYPRSFQTRRVNNSGDISWHKGRVFVSEVLRNEEIGFEQMDEDVHRVFFHHTELGEFNSSEMRFRPALRT